MTVATVRLGDLKIVTTGQTYPRQSGIDMSHVRDMIRAIESGSSLPSPTRVRVNETTMQVVDGVHRVTAWKKVRGDNGEIESDLLPYATDLDMYIDAAALNSEHGKPLTQYDKNAIVVRLRQEGTGYERISYALKIPETRAKEILNYKVAYRQEDDGTRTIVAAKQVAYPKRGQDLRVLTQQQAGVMAGSSGLRPTRAVNQLVRELRSGLIDLTYDPGLVPLLWELYELLEEILPGRPADLAGEPEESDLVG